MSEKRRGLGKGLGALIPSAPSQGRPIDVFFADHHTAAADAASRAARAADEALQEELAAVEAATGGNGTATHGFSNGGTTSTSTATRPERTAIVPRITAPSGYSNGLSGADQSPEPEPAPIAAPGIAAQAGSGDAADARGGAEEAGPGSSPDAPGTVVDAPENERGRTDDGELRAVPGAFFAEVAIDDIVANRRQPRQVFDEEELEELASSIREVGVLQPIVLRELPAGDDAGYELIMGERRWRASRLAGNDTVPAIIRETGDADLLRDALLENLHRAQLNPLEEAAAYSQLLEDFGCTHDELAARIARSRPQISNTLRLLKLPPLVQRRVAAGVLSAGHARALLGLSDGGAMERLAQRIVSEGLSVRTTEEIVALGDEPVQPEMRRRPRVGEYTPELNNLAGRLADTFDTRVKVALGQRKGRINIEFASMEDLNRILQLLAPNDPGVPTHPAAGAPERN